MEPQFDNQTRKIISQELLSKGRRAIPQNQATCDVTATTTSYLWVHMNSWKTALVALVITWLSNSSFCCMKQLGLLLLSCMDASPSQSYIPLPSILLAAPTHSLLWLKRVFGVHFLFKVTIPPSTWWQVESRMEWPTHLHCTCNFVEM